MKISNETKVGILTITALTLLIVGFNFLKGKDVFDRADKIYMVFSNIGSLTKSNEVKINGYVIGKVYDLKAKDKDLSGVVAVINLSENVNIPKDSKGYISTQLLGSAIIVIEKGIATEYLKPGDTLMTRLDAGILDDVKAQLNPTLLKVRDVLDSLKQTLSGVNGMLTSEAKGNIQQTLANLSKATGSLNTILNSENGPLVKTLNNAASITDNLRKNNDSITATISNAKKMMSKFADLQVQPTIDSLNATISQMKTLVTKLSSTNGTLGALMNDKQLYNRLNDAILSAETLIDDLRAHPKRYVNLSVFGKKDKGGYLTSPLPKDTVPTGGH